MSCNCVGVWTNCVRECLVVDSLVGCLSNRCRAYNKNNTKKNNKKKNHLRIYSKVARICNCIFRLKNKSEECIQVYFLYPWLCVYICVCKLKVVCVSLTVKYTHIQQQQEKEHWDYAECTYYCNHANTCDVLFNVPSFDYIHIWIACLQNLKQQK